MRDYVGIAIDYAVSVTENKDSTHGKLEVLAGQRFLNDLEKVALGKANYTFDHAWVFKVCKFIEMLHHVEGVWETPTLVLEPWQIFIVANIFGFRTPDGWRRFNTVYIEVARKNGKSAFAAAMVIVCLALEDEPGAQVKIGATTGKQARIVFGVASKMILKDSELAEAYDLQVLANAITCGKNWGNAEPINAKASTQDGLNPHLTVLDELHAHPNRELFDVLKSARGARKNPLSLYITTAGYNTHGVCYEQRSTVVKILTGVFAADHYFGVIYTIDKDEGDDPFDPKVWPKANPNYNVSVNPREFQTYADEAKMSADSFGEFLTKRLNVWTTAKDAYYNMEFWKKCKGSFDRNELLQVQCFGGLDLASVSDIAAFVLIWKHLGAIKIFCRFYVPEDKVFERTRKGSIPYQEWVDKGYLIATPGNVIDYEFIEEDIKFATQKFSVKAIAYDPWNATDLVNRLVEDGAPMVEFRQGARSFNNPMKALDVYIRAGLVYHDNNPALEWMVSNIVARKDPNENVAPDKKNSGDKIDGGVALLMAIGMAGVTPESGSRYENEGLFIL